MNNSGQQADSSLSSIIVGLSAVELAVHPIPILASIFNFALLYKITLLHPNLRCILLIQSCTIFISEFSRELYVVLKFIMATFTLLPALPLSATALFANTFRDFLCHVLLAERAFATIFYRKYEKCKSVFANLLWIAALTLIGIWTITSQNGNQGMANEWAICRILFGFILELSEILIMVYIYFFNKRKYGQEIASTLNQRFQLSENIRTARQLAPTFVLQFFNFVVNNCPTLFIFFNITQNRYNTALVFNIVCIFNAIINVLVELTVIIHHPILRRKARHLIRQLLQILFIKRGRVDDVRRRQGSATRSECISLKNINGKELINNSDQNAYFRMLSESWK